MKLGSFEGTPAEFDNVISNHGFKPEQFLEGKPKLKINGWIVVVLSITFAVSNYIVWDITLEGWQQKGIILLNLMLIIFIAALVQLKYDRWEVSSLSFLGGLTVMALCLGYITPKQAIEKLNTNSFHEKSTSDTTK